MKYNIMKKWVKALRSGRYEQTQHVLKDDSGYCCLGVLCDVIGKEWTEDQLESHGVSGYGIRRSRNKDVGGAEFRMLPKNVLKECGIKDGNGRFEGGGEEVYSLAQLNDDGQSFKQLAEVIEKNWKRI